MQGNRVKILILGTCVMDVNSSDFKKLAMLINAVKSRSKWFHRSARVILKRPLGVVLPLPWVSAGKSNWKWKEWLHNRTWQGLCPRTKTYNIWYISIHCKILCSGSSRFQKSILCGWQAVKVRLASTLEYQYCSNGASKQVKLGVGNWSLGPLLQNYSGPLRQYENNFPNFIPLPWLSLLQYDVHEKRHQTWNTQMLPRPRSPGHSVFLPPSNVAMSCSRQFVRFLKDSSHWNHLRAVPYKC